MGRIIEADKVVSSNIPRLISVTVLQRILGFLLSWSPDKVNACGT
jgi:hypothetical protein